jgi:hypothetical protein
LEFGIPCICIVLLLVALWLMGRWILSPFAEAVRILRAPRRFLLSDFIWLFVLLQASLAAARFALDETSTFVIILGFLVLASIAIWGGAVSALSRAGVSQASRRGVFVLVLLPAILVLMAGIAAELVSLAALCVAVFTSELEANLGLWMAPLGVPVIAAAGWALRRLTRWVVADVQSSDVPDKDQQRETQTQIFTPSQTPAWEPEQEGVTGSSPFLESFSGDKENESD